MNTDPPSSAKTTEGKQPQRSEQEIGHGLTKRTISTLEQPPATSATDLEAKLQQQLLQTESEVDAMQTTILQGVAAVMRVNQQLLQAQAVIANIRIGIYPAITHVDAQWLNGIIDSLDLSALDKHDQEVRKPLVDALEAEANLWDSMVHIDFTDDFMGEYSIKEHAEHLRSLAKVYEASCTGGDETHD